MTCARAWRALMRRNLVYRKRYWIGAILEIVLPVLFVWFLVGIRDLSNLEPKEIDAKIPTTAIIPMTFRDYVTAMKAERVCIESRPATATSKAQYSISGIDSNTYNVWQVPFVKCDAKFCQADGEDATDYCEYAILAVTGSDEGGKSRAALFKSWVDAIYEDVKASATRNYNYDIVQLFHSPAAMDAYVKDREYGTVEKPKIGMGVVWQGNSDNSYTYSLRQNSTNYNGEPGRPARRTTPDTEKITEDYAKEDKVCTIDRGEAYLGPFQNSCTGQYIYNGVLTIQRLVGDFILDRTGSSESGYYIAEAGVQFTPFPTRAYVSEGYFEALGVLGPLLVVLGMLYPVAAMISYIVKEKELRQKELMKMMSVTECDIGWSWFISFFYWHFITATLSAVVSVRLYEQSQGGILWLFWILSFIALIVFCMAIASVTSKSTRAVLIGLLLFLGGVFLTLAVDYRNGNAAVVGVISLHPVSAFTYGLQQIGLLEDLGFGLTFDTVGTATGTSGYTFGSSLRWLIIDCALWGVITWYLNRVVKPDYGQASPPWFPFTTRYWCPGKVHAPICETDVAEKMSKSEIPYEAVGEAVSRQAEEGTNIEIHDLKKEFGEKKAVDGLNLSMYSGQITALLGHNGAGKTTTINMLTGAMSATSGYATVAGNDIRTDLPAIRQDIGICLQHDCLFPDLTVREHVQFFSRLKGLYRSVSKAEANAQIDQTIRDVALFEKRNTFSKNLSGGMKRKLSVSMAFCGGSKVVLLDEPTSGMDPFSRRFTWNVIRNYRQDRCIILTTHFMDEADILGDRIAIMAEGQLRCAGSSLFLKKYYGVGYQLTVEKSPVVSENKKDDAVATTDLEELVNTAVPESTLLNNVGTEMRYQLPMGASSKFAAMFEALDREVEKGTVVSYGVSMTTLDEVFLLVARGDTVDEKKSHLASSRKITDGGDDMEQAPLDDTKSVRSRMDLEKEGASLFCVHLGALFKKRAANFRRDKRAWVCTTILPSVFVLIGFIVYTVATAQRDLVPVALDLNDFNGGGQNPIAYNNPGNYTCQPGACAYRQNSIVSEGYAFCGAPGYLQDGYSCSIAESADAMKTLMDFDGSTPMGVDAKSVEDSSKSLVKTSMSYASSQYGAIWFNRELDSTASTASSSANDSSVFSDLVVEQCKKNIVLLPNISGADVYCETLKGFGYVVQYNFTGLHTAPLFQTLADQALVRHASNNEDFVIKTTIAPLPITSLEEGFGQAQDATVAWFLLILSFPFIAGSFASFVVQERESKAKHLQTVAGVKPAAYWLSTFLWDTMNYQIPMWLTVIFMFAFSFEILTTTEQDVVSGVICLLFFFGPAAAGFSYCWSFAFTSPSLCNTFIIIFGFLVGMGGTIACFVLQLLSIDNPDGATLITAATVINWILRFTPTFCLAKGLFFAINIEVFSFIEQDPNLSAWSAPVLLWEVVFLVLQGFLYLGLAIVLDIWSGNPRIMSMWREIVGFFTCRWMCKGNKGPDITTALPEDDDVIAEQDRVLSGGANNDLVVLSQLTKVYSNGKMAVNNVSLGIPPGECFGLLGINGAGKTSVMGMLTAEFPPSNGDASLAGFSVTNEPQKIRRRIGYCPQFDAHFANMTGREHVELYASIKGVPKKFVKEAAASKLQEVGLSEYDSGRLCAQYSGGMKRRLSLACATIGQPQIVFLDECSTGVDPVARREIWKLVSDMVAGGNFPEEERTSVVLTTHSMEECEALCPRIGIMANGRLRCLGSAQHLKGKFGQGFQVELKAKNVDRQDDDYVLNTSTLAAFKNVQIDPEGGQSNLDLFFNSEDTKIALRQLTGDEFLSDMVNENDPAGYNIWRDSTSPVGVALDALAAFATTELRMRSIENFVSSAFSSHILRERQDTKARYEVSMEGSKISSIFASIESNKDKLRLQDYGVSQTSLEQVFNHHAAEAEKLKQGRDDH